MHVPLSGVPCWRISSAPPRKFPAGSGLPDSQFLSSKTDPQYHWLSEIPYKPLERLVL